MKKSILALGSMLPAMYLLTACFECADPLEMASDRQQVTFSFDSFALWQTPLQAETRAITNTPIALLVIDEMEGEVLQVKQLTSDQTTPGTGAQVVEDVLADLTLDMVPGSHNVYFVAACKAYDSFDADALTVTWDNATASLSYTWAQKLSVTVTSTASAARSVTMPLVVGRVELECLDAQDPDIDRMHIAGTDICWTLNLESMTGEASDNGVDYSIAYTSSNKNAGKKFAFFSFEPQTTGSGTPTVGDVTFTAEREDGSAIVAHTLSNVPVRKGYLTHYSGAFYDYATGFTFSLANDWSGTMEETF